MFFIEEMHELCLLYSLSFWRCTAKVELLRRAASFRSEASSEAQAKRRACAGHRAIQKCHGQSDGWLYKMPCMPFKNKMPFMEKTWTYHEQWHHQLSSIIITIAANQNWCCFFSWFSTSAWRWFCKSWPPIKRSRQLEVMDAAFQRAKCGEK